MWGGVIGTMLLVPVFGAVVGGLGGALVGSMTDVGVDDTFMERIGRELAPRTAAVFFIARQGNARAVLNGMAPFGGEVLQTTISEDAERSLREALGEGGQS